MPTTLTFSLTTPTGAPLRGGKLTFLLSGFDLDSGIIMPSVVEALVDLNGTGTVELWPNHAGLRGTTYKVTIYPEGRSAIEAGSITVPESEAPVALHSLLPVGTVAGLRALVMTQAEYDALETRSDQIIYLIRAEV